MTTITAKDQPEKNINIAKACSQVDRAINFLIQNKIAIDEVSFGIARPNIEIDYTSGVDKILSNHICMRMPIEQGGLKMLRVTASVSGCYVRWIQPRVIKTVH